MSRVSGATVLLILVATVSAYTCAILGGAALGRMLDSSTATTVQPTARDIALRVSVSFRGLAEDFVKELWGGNPREGHALSSPAAHASLRVTQAELDYLKCQHMVAQRATTRSRRENSRRDDVHEGGAAAATAMPVSMELWRGYYREGRQTGGGPHAGAGDRAGAALSTPAAHAAGLQYPLGQAMRPLRMTPQLQRSYLLHRDISRSDGVHEGAAAATPVPRHRTCSSDTELRGGHHREEGRSGGRVHAGASDRAASSLPSSAPQASLRLAQQAEQEYRQRQIVMQQLEAIRMENSIGEGTTITEQRTARSMPRHRKSNFSDDITEGIKVGPWGGSGGQPFHMRGRGYGGAPRLLSVTIHHADAVHAFRFEYLLGGVRRTMGPSGGHYYRSKGLRATINFSSDERLIAVEGTFGRCRGVLEVVVTSLTFRTDKGRTYGPYGEEKGTSFSIPAENGCIVGFWGRSGSLLDAIGVYIMPCQVNKPRSFVGKAYNGTS